MTSGVVMADYISLRAYARRRGVALSAVQKAIDSRRVTAIREEGDRITGIDPLEADKQWAANTDAIEAARNGKFLEAPAGHVSPPPAATSAPGGEKPSGDKADQAAGDQGNFLAALIKEAELRGELLELDKLERMYELGPWTEIEAEFGEIFTQLRSAVFHIPDRKAQALAGETDPVRVHRLLTDELRAVFDEFSRRLSEAAATGLVGDARMAAESEVALS